MDPKVAAVFEAYPEPARAALLRLRDLVFETARQTDGVGELEETLKWGQPSYLTPKSRSGSTLRLDALKGAGHGYALYVNCKTDLAETFRGLYGEALALEGERAVLFDARTPPDEAMVRHCIALTLTYHHRKRRTIVQLGR